MASLTVTSASMAARSMTSLGHRHTHLRANFTSGVFAPSRHAATTTLTTKGRRTREVTVMGIFGLGLPEVAVIAGVAVVLFGPSKLPELGKNLGKTVRSLQDAAQEFKEELDEELAKGPEDDEGEQPEE